jgi:hypothetical protein
MAQGGAYRHWEGRYGSFWIRKDFMYEYCISRIGFTLALDTISWCITVGSRLYDKNEIGMTNYSSLFNFLISTLITCTP